MQTHAQTERHPVACITLLKLIDLRKALDPEKPIVCGANTIPAAAIHPHVATYCMALRANLDKRFFNRYRDDCPSRGSGKPAKSFLLEMTTMMHPTYKRLGFLDELLLDMGIEPAGVKELVRNRVIDLTILVANSILVEQGDNGAMRALNFTEQPEPDLDVDVHLADGFRELNFNSAAGDDVRALVAIEFDKYMQESGGGRSRAAQADILDWWRLRARKYPYLSELARRLLATEASAGYIELDFSVGGQFVDKGKMGLSSENLEMKLFIHRNLNFLDWNRMVSINLDSIHAHMPQTPAVPFVENEEEMKLDE